MNKRYYIELSRNDIGIVSYFPGLELKDAMNYDWIDDVLVPAVKPIAQRKSKKIQEMPITFWVCVRGTARRGAEIFLFVTPAYPGSLIEKALERSLQPLLDGKVHAGREPMPDYAYPCMQIFRKKMIRFYLRDKTNHMVHWPIINFENDKPELVILPDHDYDGTFELLEELGGIPVEARILTVSSGNECREFQQMLIPVAREID